MYFIRVNSLSFPYTLLKKTGNIGVLKQLYNLERLVLNDTQVGGGIMNLAHLNDIKGIGLSNTKVNGELMHLASLTVLRGLKLDGTNVTPGTHIHYILSFFLEKLVSLLNIHSCFYLHILCIFVLTL